MDLMGLISSAPYLASDSQNNLVINLLFLGTLHNIFTLMLVQNSEEFASRARAVHGKWTWFFFAAVGIVTATAFCFVAQMSHAWAATFCIFFAMIIPRFHNLSQLKGLSLNLVRTGNSNAFLPQVWNLSIVIFITSHVLLRFSSAQAVHWIVTGMNLAFFMVLLWMTIAPLEKTHYPRSHVLLFHSKVLLFPAALLSPMAGWMVAALHGLEYASVATHNLKAEDIRQRPRPMIWAGAALILLTGITYFAIMGEGFWGYVALGTMMGVSTAHYCYDAVLFRTRKFYRTE